VLSFEPTIACWTYEHNIFTILSLLFVMIYFITAIANYSDMDYYIRNLSQKCDIKWSPFYNCSQRILEFLLVFVLISSTDVILKSIVFIVVQIILIAILFIFKPNRYPKTIYCKIIFNTGLLWAAVLGLIDEIMRETLNFSVYSYFGVILWGGEILFVIVAVILMNIVLRNLLKLTYDESKTLREIMDDKTPHALTFHTFSTTSIDGLDSTRGVSRFNRMVKTALSTGSLKWKENDLENTTDLNIFRSQLAIENEDNVNSTTTV